MSELDDPTLPASRALTASVSGVARASVAPAHLAPGALVLRYRIVSVLGEGGMGTVYLARQEKPDREVALKVVRPGYATERMLRRFEMEAEVLGRLLHPGIAQIYEAGVFEVGAPPGEGGSGVIGRMGTPPAGAGGSMRIPFFAMELVKGVALTRYAEEKKLSTRERLELVARVCDAVQHAHQKGVIHRDLKPSNILVTEEGQPKILDFGVARATDSDIQRTTMETDVGAIIGTIPYMSPEQVGGDPGELDTRSDVYALGVIAYELLVGRLPYDLERKMIHEAARVIREEEPTRLSSIDRALRGDVETIVAHALEKDRARRYGAASALAADIRRYLSDEPIAARPASGWYQFVKFSKRHKGLVAGVAASFVVLAAGLGITVVQRAHAEMARVESDLIAAFMSDTLKGAGPSVARGRDTTMLREMMNAASERIDRGELRHAPNAEQRLRQTIGMTYFDLDAYGDALRMLEEGARLARERHAGDHMEVAESEGDLAVVLGGCGEYERAEALARRALEMKKRLLPAGHPEIAVSMNNLVEICRLGGSFDEAEPLARESVRLFRSICTGDDERLATAVNNLGLVVQGRGDLAEAQRLFRESLEMRLRLHPGDHPLVATGLNNLMGSLIATGEFGEAVRVGEDALAMSRRLFPPDHSQIATCLNNLGLAEQSLGNLDAAESHYVLALEMTRRLFPTDHQDVAQNAGNLAVLNYLRGDLEKSESLFRESNAMLRRVFPADHPLVMESTHNLGRVMMDARKFAEAEPLLREAVGLRERVLGRQHPDTWESESCLALLCMATARHAEAAGLVEAMSLEVEARLGSSADETREAVGKVVSVYESWDKEEPGKGYGVKAAEWKARLGALAAPPPSPK